MTHFAEHPGLTLAAARKAEGEAMPSYFYQLKFELYPTSNPAASASGSATSSGSAENLWLPPKHANIFGDLPSHPRTKQTHQRLPILSGGYESEELKPRPTVRAEAPSVIDCGPVRAPVKDNGSKVQILSERQWRQRTKSFPPPPVTAGIRPQTAVKDWRFDRLRIESVDLDDGAVMAGESAAMSSSSALGVGPMFGGAGTATKAKYVPLEAKNTNVGWGLVHFYREGDESPELNLPAEEQNEEERGNESLLAQECTTLCIPAVPSYLTPADFLGFVGEKWRDDVSHYRMVMTARMNRYLVLMKFRDGKRAKLWKEEFDGKVFNSMEACPPLHSPQRSRAF
jgi:BRCA1-associated protein